MMRARIRFISLVFLTNLAIFLLLRLVFLFAFIPDETPLFSSPVLKAFYIGFKFDARLAALICLPILFLSGIPFLNFLKNKAGRIIWTVYLVLTFAVILLVYFIDFGSFSYIKNRATSMLFAFAETPAISAKMVWQSYAVIPIFLFYFLFIFLYLLWIKKKMSRTAVPPSPPMRSKWKKAVVYTVFGFMLVGVVYGKLARFPLRWSEAFFSADIFVSQFGVNPALYFYRSFSTQPLNYDIRKVKRYYPVLADYYQIEEQERRKLSLMRNCKPDPVIETNGQSRPNIVVIILETFAAFKAGAKKDGLDPAPNFEKLGKQGILFTRYFVPMENTSRSLFSFIFGIPDVTPGRYSSWHPLLVDQRTVLNAFSDYDKLYFLGGSANWGNIRGVLSHNVENLKIFEEGSYRSPVHDVWGISDADLFMEANQVIRKIEDKPFFAIIQTSGNHRPFKIPRDSRGFKAVETDKKILKKNGFYSIEEYNGFRFLDHCLGYYFDLAQKERYFDNTVFVILGDHGTMGGAVDTRFGDLSFGSYHVPLLIYAPGLIKTPQVVSTVMSHLDLLPSLAGLTGRRYTNTTLGRNIFDPRFREKMFAFTYTAFRIVPRVGLIEDDLYVNVEPDGSFHLYRLDPSLPLEDVKDQFPVKAERMSTMARAILEYSRWLIYHNKKN
jgi:phosphoglycerol transferase MdoB-like AlkP superfamily enzyme